MEEGGVLHFRKEKTKKVKSKTKQIEDGLVENYGNNKKSTNLEEIEMESIEEGEEKKKRGRSGHKESPSSSLGDPWKIAKNEDNHFDEEVEEIDMESRNDETKKEKKKKEEEKKDTDHKESTRSSWANKELLDDDAIEMELGNNDEQTKMKEKVIEGVEIDEETESAWDKESIDNKKKKRKKTGGFTDDASGSESSRSVNLEDRRKEKKKKEKKKKKRDIQGVEANEKTESSRDTVSIDNEELKNSGKSKTKTEGSINDARGSEGNESVNLEETQTEMSNDEKNRMKRTNEKDPKEFEFNEKTKTKDTIGSKKRKGTEGTINDTSESENKKRKKRDKASTGDKDKVDKNASNLEKKKSAVKSKTKEKEKPKRVRFSGDVEVVPPSDDSDVEVYDEGNLVRGKRFSPAEDKLIREAVQNYIDINQLGEEGLEMVLYSSKHPQVKGCWKEICAAIPWRPCVSVYARARTMLQMSEKRGFSEEEREIILKFREKHGPEWVKLAKLLGKPRIHVKDAWRRFRLPNVKAGKWSQDEYQALFDLVNLDLRIKSFQERENQNIMFRENIAWEAISEKISTRSMSTCCHKWYDQLTSPLVRQGEWADTNDYQLIDALQKQDACDVEDVDWDHLLQNRSGEICRKRWDEMVRYIGGNQERSFIEQVDVLSKRYCIDMLQYRKSKGETEKEKEEELNYGS